MIVTPIKTALVKQNDDLFKIIKKSITKLPDESVLVITSKIISFCQGRIVKKTTNDQSEKHQLVKKEADYYLEPHSSQYQVMLTIKDNTLSVNAGIDESNADDGYVLWPKNLQKTTNDLWRFLREDYQVNKVGVIVTDSKTLPLRWGVVGTAISHCGFQALHDYRGARDLFGREIRMSQINVAEAIAVAAVLEMGEVAERTPLCLVKDIKKIKFQNRPPTAKELVSLRIKPEDDVYAPLLTSVQWKG
ncbi:coenzyme F420-0:L-glutamate ligase [Candidatus Microgenomates bacterium]|nr:coenzyme F420-0:L-glutamate ligase [Candidatus Microgenomates bacterium]